MLGLENLSTGQKIQIALVVLMFTMAGGYTAYNWNRIMGQERDDTINSWTRTQTFGTDPERPISPTNVLDPTRTEVVSVFRCVDGSLVLTEYPNDTSRATAVSFDTDHKRKNYVRYAPPMQNFESISDPSTRAITWAASLLPRSGYVNRLVRKVEMTPDQNKAEKEARQALVERLSVINTQISGGTLEPKSYQAMLDALAKYKTNGEDPIKSAAKRELGHQVIQASLAYLKRTQEIREDAVSTYVAAFEKIIDGEQFKKLADALPANINTMPRRATAG